MLFDTDELGDAGAEGDRVRQGVAVGMDGR